ncbi:MAG: glycogen synthase GlgA [Blastocatellia bacterium]|nr:glycogen synthase GlgA [Blastocatellia bacterium]
MNILLAASEVVPYAKTGGLADVAAALPKALARLGHQVRIVMPRYDTEQIVEGSGSLQGRLHVPFNFTTRTSAVYVDRSGEVPVYFIDAPQYFSRGRLYGENDDVERFAYFSRAVVELAKALGGAFDIIHLNDWMTGLVPAYMRTVYSGDYAFAQTKTVFTIHNIAFAGLFGPGFLPNLGLPEWIHRADGGIEFYGLASALKAGLIFSDAITTVSPKYSREIQTPEAGQGLDGLLRARRKDMFGILNGVDYDEWSPEKDRYIAANFSPDDLDGKRECKRDLLAGFGLPQEELERPVIGCITRLTTQKGIDLIFKVAQEMLDRGVIFVLVGTGESYYEQGFQTLRDARPRQVGVYFGQDERSNELAHKIEAGADMFLMPSLFEPCGLNQMYSLKYGTVPVVRAVGGLDDTIENFDRTTRSGNGFKFYEYNPTRLLEKIYEALLVYADSELWRTLMLNGMRADHSWERSARLYVELYERLARPNAAAAD